MQRTFKYAVAAFMIALTFTAVPQKAHAAVDTYLVIDGIKSESTGSLYNGQIEFILTVMSAVA